MIQRLLQRNGAGVDEPLEPLFAVARRLLRRRRWLSLRQALLPVTAHLGSIVTILGAWFMRTGSFGFHPEKLTDWLVLLVLVVVAVSGIKLVVDRLRAPSSLEIARSHLVALLAAARDEAETSVTNMAGDLSWLPDDLPIIKHLRTRRPALTMTILYDRRRVSEALAPVMSAYAALRIQLVPYPDGFSPALRGMLIDKDSSHARRLYLYSRAASPTLGIPRDQQPFLWTEHGQRESHLLNALSSLLELLLRQSPRPLLVGISGCNNVGKTSIVRRLRQLLEQHFTVQVFGDEFRLTPAGTTFEDACATLCSQLARYSSLTAQVCIFDRTFADNLCFVRLRGSKTERLYRALAGPIADVVRTFDLNVDVRRSQEDYTAGTTHVTGEQRRRVRKYLDEFFATADIPLLQVVTDQLDLNGTVEAAAQQIAGAVLRIETRRRTGPG